MAELTYLHALWRDESTGEGLFAFIYTERYTEKEGNFYSKLPEIDRWTNLEGRIEGSRVVIDGVGDRQNSTKTKKEKERQDRKLAYIDRILKAITKYPTVPVSILEKAARDGNLDTFDTSCYDYLPFLQADRIARGSGIWLADKKRIWGAFRAAMDVVQDGGGHTVFELDKFLMIVQGFLGEPEIALSYLYTVCPSWISKDFRTNSVSETKTQRSEEKIVENIRRLMLADRDENGFPEITDDILKNAEDRCQITLGEEQKDAVKGLLNSPIAILTGDPGTGKTTTIKVLLAAYQELFPKAKIKLTAPTGRAAQRIAEITGMDAETIHRMIGYFTLGDREHIKDLNDPVDADLVIADEFSMVDTELMAWMMGAMKPTTKLIIIGDNFQLESVGCGAVLTDLIESDTLSHFHLTKIYRQGEQSSILTNSKLVKNGITEIKGDKDFLMYLAKDEEQIVRGALSIIKKNPQVQILIPTKKGKSGTFAINNEAQKLINPTDGRKREIIYNNRIFREGDKVIFTKNNASMNYMNGDMGQIQKIDDDVITITTLAGTITATREDLPNLDLAYAITIHKSQGSEFDEVLILLPYTKASRPLLKRNLIYTAITRCKKKAAVIAMEMEGNGNSLRYSIETEGKRRKTRLCELLTGSHNLYK